MVMIITPPQVKTEATDLLMVKVVTGNLEASRKEAEAKDLSINQCQFQNYRPQRGASQYNHNQYGTHCKPYFQGNQTSHYRGQSRGQGPQQIRGYVHGRANYQSNNGTYQY